LLQLTGKKNILTNKLRITTSMKGNLFCLTILIFLNKNRKLAPKFSGPFKILRVKSPHNVEPLLANGRKIVVNVARIKPYFSSASNSPLSSPSSNGSLHSNLTTDNANGFLTAKAFSDLTKTFAPPTLTPSHTRKPGRPRNLDGDSKVLSPATVSFSKPGKDSHPGGVAVAKKNETAVTVACAHPMRTRSQKEEKEEKEEISAIAQEALMSRLNNVIERSYHWIVKKPRKKTQPRPSRPKLGQSYGDPYKY
jgi:hypothetical protein